MLDYVTGKPSRPGEYVKKGPKGHTISRGLSYRDLLGTPSRIFLFTFE